MADLLKEGRDHRRGRRDVSARGIVGVVTCPVCKRDFTVTARSTGNCNLKPPTHVCDTARPARLRVRELLTQRASADAETIAHGLRGRIATVDAMSLYGCSVGLSKMLEQICMMPED